MVTPSRRRRGEPLPTDPKRFRQECGAFGDFVALGCDGGERGGDWRHELGQARAFLRWCEGHGLPLDRVRPDQASGYVLGLEVPGWGWWAVRRVYTFLCAADVVAEAPVYPLARDTGEADGAEEEAPVRLLRRHRTWWRGELPAAELKQLHTRLRQQFPSRRLP